MRDAKVDLTMTEILVNLELVRGCRNKGCSCFGTTCPQDGSVYEMSEQTLRSLLLPASPLSNVRLHDNSIYLYGLGETLEHSRLQKMVEIIKEWKPDLKTTVNSDGHYFANKTPRTIEEKTSVIEHLVISYKHNKGFLNRETIAALRPKACVHLFLDKQINEDKLLEIDDYIDRIMQLRPDDGFRLAQMWESKFEGGVPNEDLERDDFFDNIQTVPLTKSGSSEEPRAPQRVYITYQGSYRTCLFSPDDHNDLIRALENSSCPNCRLKGAFYVIDTRKEVNTSEV